MGIREPKLSKVHGAIREQRARTGCLKLASNTSIYQHKMIICDIRQKLKKTDKASARRKEHINFDIKKMREDKKKKIDLAEDEKAGKILEKYENETGRQRRQRIWKTTARIINS